MNKRQFKKQKQLNDELKEILKSMLEENPKGIVLYDAHQITGLSYSTIRKHIKNWNYEVKKIKVKRFVKTSVIIKKSTFIVNSKEVE